MLTKWLLPESSRTRALISILFRAFRLLLPLLSFLSSFVSPLLPLGLGFLLPRGYFRRLSCFCAGLPCTTYGFVWYCTYTPCFVTSTRIPRLRLLPHPELRKGPWSLQGPRGMAMAAPPCCARPFVLDRAVKEDVCLTSDTVPLCPCTGMYSRRSSRPQPMGSGGDATPCKVTREDRRLYF